MALGYSQVTELAGDEISQEQVGRIVQRYVWAAEYCSDKDVLEVACGAAPGLGYLGEKSRSFISSDIDKEILSQAHDYYQDRYSFVCCSGQQMPISDQSLDVIIIFEAIYYLPDPKAFFNECNRVLRPGGKILIVSANKDLYDFNPSPHSHIYFGVKELSETLSNFGYQTQFFGGTSTKTVSWKQKLFRPVKKIAVAFNLVPETMAGKKILKKLVFGNLVPMPAEITENTSEYIHPSPISANQPDTEYKVIYCVATKNR